MPLPRHGCDGSSALAPWFGKVRTRASQARSFAAWPYSFCSLVLSFERQLYSRNEGARRTGVDRTGGAEALKAGGRDRVSDIVRGSHISPVEYVPDFGKHAQRLEVVGLQVRVVVDVEIDQLVAGRLLQIGVVHVDRVLPLDLDKRAEPRKRSPHLVIAKPRRQFVRRDTGNLVAGAVETENRSADAGAPDVFAVFGVELIEIG